MLANKSRYYFENKERFQQYRADNAEHIAEWKREWRKNNPEMVRAHKSASQKRNRASANERTRRWNKKNPDKTRAYTLNRIARKHATDGKYTPADIAQLYEDQGGHCAYCGIGLCGEYHVDHMVPLTKGGSNWPDNLALACPTCNHSKRDLLLPEWELIRGW
jgi:5-methylcytosine-specific restriction endonuclease McrA